MAKIRDLAVGRSSEIFFFDPQTIKEFDNFNPRDYEAPEVKEHIERMAKCIQENGVLGIEPITVSQVEGEIFVLRGHCRRRAFLLAKEWGVDFKGIRAYVDQNSTEQDRTLDLLNSNSGLPLNQLEKATVVERLVKLGWTTGEIAKKMGVSHAAVNNLMILLNAPEEIKEMVKEGLVSSTLATETIQERGPEEATKDITKAAEGGKRVTAKTLPSKIKKVTVMRSEGIGKFAVKNDKFELDSAEGDFPCMLCLHRKDYETCKDCGHFIEGGLEVEE